MSADPVGLTSCIDALAAPLLALLAQSNQGYALFDQTDTLRLANDTFRSAMGLHDDEYPTWVDLMRLGNRRQTGTVVTTDDFEVWLASAQSRRGKQPYRTIETVLHDGRWVLITETTMPDGWMLCCLTDVTELRSTGRTIRQARDRALRAALSDELTGLSNRRYMMDRLARALGPGWTGHVTVVLLDLDHFKKVNDSHGHDVGDRVLRHFAGLLQENIRRDDAAGRLGGEEFLLIMPTMLPRAEEAAERLLQAVRQSVPVDSLPELRYTCSAGIATAYAGESVKSLLKRADDALYAAKHAGRDRYRIALGGGTGVAPTST